VARVAVIGAGIGGLATALLLGRRGHTVTLFERERRQAGDDLDADFLDWRRPRVPQAVQPHGLLGPVRTVLRAEAPDVYADLLARGVTEYHEFDWFPAHPPYREGDDELVRLRSRRIVLEAALAAAVRREPTVETVHGAAVRGLTVVPGAVPHVTGVRTDDGPQRAELVVDASGRRSPVARWLKAAGCRPPTVESHRTGLSYLCRWYRTRDDGARDPGRVPSGSMAPFAIAGVFPSDNRTFALHVALATKDPTRAALRDPAVFEAVTRRFPATAAWLGLDPVPVTPVLTMAGLDNRWTSLADGAGRPLVTGIVGVGDSLLQTNPTMGQGIALTLWTARWLADNADRTAADPAAYHAWTRRKLRPWFEAQVAGDQAIEQRLAAGPPLTRESAARSAAACDDPVVMRAQAQVRHMLRTPDEAYGTHEVRGRIADWLAARPGFTPSYDGPTREEWNELVGS
jgi:2-polyprenyl-6-methoxyphenol hydroxylase-like FAD-dependent oxidoreductase